MQKKHRLAVRSGARLAVAEYAQPRRRQAIARGADILHLVADVVDAARRVARQKARYRRLLSQRLEQLDFRVGQRHEYGRHPVFGQIDGLRRLGAERIPVKRRRRPQIGHGDGHVVESSDHRAPSPPPP